MPIDKLQGLQGLRGLKGLNTLSPEERNAFMQANESKLSAYRNPMKRRQAANILYMNQKYINTFGLDDFNLNNDGTEASFNMRNDKTKFKIVTDTFKNQLGKESNFNELATFLDVDGMYDLLNNQEYLTDKQLKQKYEGNLKAAGSVVRSYDKAINNPYVDALGEGFMQVGKISAAETPGNILNKDIERNKEILEKLKDESRKRREAAVQGDTDMIYANMLMSDDTGKQSLAKTLNEFDKIASKSSHYDAFKNSKWLRDYSNEDKLKDYSKYLALKSRYGEAVADQYLEMNMQNKVAEAQDGKWTGNTLKGIITTAWSDIGSNVALFANAGSLLNTDRMAILNQGKDPDKPIYDKKGNIVDYKENTNIWTNPAYWNNVYKYNTFSPTEIKAIQERGGVSEDVNVRAYGYVPDFLSWDTAEEGAKQSGHILAGVAETALTGGTGKAIGWAGKTALKGIGLSAKAMQTASKLGTITNDIFVAATTGLEGAQLEAMGTFDEQMESAKEKINSQIGRELSEYMQSINYNSKEAKAGINAFYNRLKAKDARRVALGNREGTSAFPLSDATLKAQAKQLYTNQLLGAKQKELQELHKKDELEAAKVAAKAYGTNFIMDYIKNIPITTGIQKFKIAKGAMRGAFDETINKNIIADVESGGVKRVVDKAGNTVKYTSGKKLGKELLKQLGGGFADEYLDGINASFAGGVGNNMFDNYIRKNYDPKAYDSTVDSFLGNMLAGFSEGIDGLTDRQNLYEGFIGMVSPVATTMVNPNAVYRPKDAWKAVVNGKDSYGNKMNIAERASSVLMNPLLNAYADAKEKDRALDRTVEAINAVVSANKDKINDAAKIISVLNNYDSPVTVKNPFSILDYKDNKLYNSFTLINALNSLENIGGGVNSKLYQDTMHTIQGLAEGTLSQEELDNEIDMALGDKDNKSILEDKNAREEAANRLQKNAKYFMDMKDKMAEIQSIFAKSPKLMKEDPMVQSILMYNLVATDDYRKRLKGIEDELGLGHTDTESMFTPDYSLRYGTDQAKKRGIAAREREINRVQKEIDRLNNANSYIEKKIKVLEKQSKVDFTDNTIEDKIKKQKKLLESQKFMLKTLEKEKKQFTKEKEEINKVEMNKGIGTNTFSQEGLLNSDIRDLAYVLNNDNISNFSEGRKAIIDNIKSSLEQKDPEAMQKIADASTLATRIEDAKTAYNRIMNNKELASTYIDAVSRVRERDAIAESVQRQIKEHYGKIESAYIDRENEPKLFKDEILSTNTDLMDAYKEDHPDQVNAIKPYYDMLKFDEDAAAIIHYSDYSDEDKQAMRAGLIALRYASNSREELETKIEELIDSKDLDQNIKDKYENLLSTMESLGHQRNAAIVEARKERLQREEEERKKKEEEKKKVEDEAKEAAEKKTNEVDNEKVPNSKDDVNAPDDSSVFHDIDENGGSEINDKTVQVDNPTNGEINSQTTIHDIKQSKPDKDVDLDEDNTSVSVEEKDLQQEDASALNAGSLMKDNFGNGSVDMGDMWYGTTGSPKKGKLLVDKKDNNITFKVNGTNTSIEITPEEYEIDTDKQEESSFDRSKINKGFSVDSHNKLVDEGSLQGGDVLYSGYIENDKVKMSPKDVSHLSDSAMTFFNVSGNSNLNSHAEHATLVKPAILSIEKKKKDGQTHYKLQSKGEIYFGDSKGNSENKKNTSFFADSLEKKDGEWYFNGNFAGNKEKTQVKAKKDFNIDKAIERQQAANEADLAAKGIDTGNKNLIDNGDSVLGKSETIDEQLEDTTSTNKEIHSSDDNVDAAELNGIGQHHIETSVTTLSGNAMSEYNPTVLQNDGIIERKKGSETNDNMNQYYAWMNAAGVKLQNIIDHELAKIIRRNPNAKVKFMAVKPERNATNDVAMQSHLMLVLDYDNNINKGITAIHDDANGGVIESNGKKYLIIGTAGYGNRNASKLALYDILWNPYISGGLNLKKQRKQFFDAHLSERFYVNENISTEIVPTSLIPGYIVRQTENDNNSEFRSVRELLSDTARNPMHYDLDSVAWGIQERSKFLVVGTSLDKVMIPRDPMGNLGSAFVLMPASNGKMVPSYLKVLKYNEMRDGSLKDKINTLLQEVTSPNYKTRLNAVIGLSKIFYFDKEGDTILLRKNRDEISLVHDGKVQKTFVLNDNFDRAEFMQNIQDMNPRINITASVLRDIPTLMEYDEAGALMTDAALFGTAGSSYSIYGLDGDGKMIKPESPTNDMPKSSNNSDFKNGDKSQVIFKHQYYREVNGVFSLNGEIITDEATLKQLGYNKMILDNQLSPSMTKGVWEYFILSEGENPKAIKVNRNTKEVKESSEEQAKELIEKINEEESKKLREQKAQEAITEIGKAEDVDLGEYTLTVDPETGELVQADTQSTSSITEESTDEKEVSPTTEKTSNKDDYTHTSSESLNSAEHKAATQKFSDLIKDKKYMLRVMKLVRNKWKDAPKKITELEKFLRDKNVEVDAIGTSDNDIEAWIRTIEDCR